MAYRTITVDTSKLYTLSNGSINWKKSVGLNLQYKVDETDYSGFIKLIGVEGGKLFISIDDNPTIMIRKESLRKGLIAKQLGAKAKIFKYNVGDVVNNQKIIEQIIIQHYSTISKSQRVLSHENGYVVECLKDHYRYEILEKSLTRGRSCPVCGQNKVVPGINDIATTNPKLAEWFVDKSLTLTLSKDTNKQVMLKCPVCGRLFIGIPNHFKKGYPSCPCQKSASSYPERLFASILNQLDIKYISQLSKSDFEWCKSYRYDFYFEICNDRYIVELDGGLGHGKQSYYNNISEFNASIKRDRTKDQLALQHGIKLIRIDVDYPDVRNRFQFIYDNIVSSELNNIFDFNLINLHQCEVDAESSLIVTIGKMWDDENLTQTEIKRRLQIGDTTVSAYLKKGRKLGLNNYVSHTRKYVPDYIKKNIKVTNSDNEVVCVHKGIADFQRNSKNLINKQVDISTIYRSIKTGRHTNDGFLFSYATEDELQNYQKINKGGKNYGSI